MADQFRVTLVACIAGNPFKAWHGSTGPDDAVNIPDDEWQDQTHDFASLDDAKSFIRALPVETTTHVVLTRVGDDGTETLYVQDFGDDLESAAPGVVAGSQEPAVPPDTEAVVPVAPPLLPAQVPAQEVAP